MIMITIQGDAVKTKFMQAADVFKPWKVLGEVQIFKIDKDDLPVKDFQDTLVSEAEASGEFIVSLVWFPESEVAPYINPKVKVISNGTNWSTLHKILEHYKVPHEVDDELFCRAIEK